jgi:hypothetical protein
MWSYTGYIINIAMAEGWVQRKVASLPMAVEG